MSLFINIIDSEMEIGSSNYVSVLKNSGYLASLDMEAMNTKEICRTIPMVCIPSFIVPLIYSYHCISTRGIYIGKSNIHTDSDCMVLCITWWNDWKLFKIA